MGDPLTQRALEQMVVGVATRKYKRSLETLPEEFEERGTSKSAVSRRFVEATSSKLTEWMSRPLGEIDICAVFIDGLHFAERIVLIALGVDSNGTKHVLGVAEGATEDSVASRALLNDLVTRGLDPKRRRLFVIDGAPALRSAIRELFGNVRSCSAASSTRSPTCSHGYRRASMRPCAPRCGRRTRARRWRLPSGCSETCSVRSRRITPEPQARCEKDSTKPSP